MPSDNVMPADNFFTTFTSKLPSLPSIFFPSPTPDPSKQIKEIEARSKAKFDVGNSDHIKIVVQYTTNLKTQLENLQRLDLKIVIGFAVVATAFIFSAILPFSSFILLATAGTVGYWIKQRELLDNEYRIALSQGVAALDWTLNPTTPESNEASSSASASASASKRRAKSLQRENLESVQGNSEVNALLDIISLLLNEEQMKEHLHDLVEGSLIEKAKKLNQTILGRPLTKEEKTLAYGIYGYEQGGLIKIGQGLWYLAAQAVTSLVSSVTDLWQSDKKQRIGDENDESFNVINNSSS